MTESGLVDALGRGVLYTPRIDEQLTRLLDLLVHLDDGSWADGSTEDPRLATVRATAAALLQLAAGP